MKCTVTLEQFGKYKYETDTALFYVIKDLLDYIGTEIEEEEEE